MTESLWKRIASLLQAPKLSNKAEGAGGKGVKNEGSKPKCSHCRSVDLHEHLDVWPMRMVRPVKDLTEKSVQVAVKAAVVKFKSNKGMEGGFKAALEEAKARQEE